MKQLTRRLGVGVVAASLALSSSMAAFAAAQGEGELGGAGSIEGIVDTDVFEADLPTDNTAAYDYIADPQGLIRKTNAAKYSGKTFSDGTIFFLNKDGNYSNTSDSATIVNKSSKPISVQVTATATPGASGASLATSSTFSGTDKEVYLGIKDSVEGSTEQAVTTGAGTTLTAVLGAAPADAFEYSYSDNGYDYAIKDDVSGFNFAEYSFQITGAANEKATDWEASTALPAIEVTWEVDFAADGATVTVPTPTAAAPGIATTSLQYTAGQDLEITVNLGNGDLAATGIKSVTFENNGAVSTLPTTRWSYNAGKLTFNNSYTTALAGKTRTHTITFNDSASTTVNVTLRPAP